MNQQETKTSMRATAMGAAQSCLRKMGLDPAKCSPEDAELALSDISYRMPHLIATEWYRSATANQWRLFYQEWRAWVREVESRYEGLVR